MRTARHFVCGAMLLGMLTLSAGAQSPAVDQPSSGAPQPAVAQPSAESMFNDLFGKEYHQALASTRNDDNLSLARRMLKIAPEIVDNLALFELVCQRVYALTCKLPDGYAIALASQELLADKSAAQRSQALHRIVDLRQHNYSTLRGEARREAADPLIDALSDAAQDERDQGRYDQAILLLRRAQGLATSIRSDKRPAIQQQFTEVAADQRRQQLAQRLIKKLNQNPADKQTARDLVTLYLVEMDQPDKAGVYTLPLDDPQLQEHIALTCKRPDKLTEAEWLKLGDWYFKLAEQAPADAKARMYQHAVDYLHGYLDHHADHDVNRIKAELQAKRASEQLEKLSPRPLRQSWSDGAVVAVTFDQNTIQKTDEKTVAANLLGDPPQVVLNHAQIKPGALGQAVQIGAASSSHINTHLDASGPYRSFAFWAKADDITLASKYGCTLFGIYRDNNRLYVGYNSHHKLNLGYAKTPWDKDPSTITLDNRWHFYTLVRTDEKATLYFDGRPVVSRTGPSQPVGTLYLGSQNHDVDNSSAYPFPGLFDEFAAWKRPLTDQQVAELYRYSKTGKSFCLLLYKLNKK